LLSVPESQPAPINPVTDVSHSLTKILGGLPLHYQICIQAAKQGLIVSRQQSLPLPRTQYLEISRQMIDEVEA
jgi:hypothetical protein